MGRWSDHTKFCAESSEAESDHMKKLPPSRPCIIQGVLEKTRNKGGSHHVLYRDRFTQENIFYYYDR